MSKEKAKTAAGLAVSELEQAKSPAAKARLSAVVVTFNCREQVGAALRAVLGELEQADELIVVDNASGDGTAEAVAELGPAVTLIRQRENVGFAAAANAGAARSSGDLLVFLNPDAVPAPGFGEAIRRPLDDDRAWSAWMGLVTADGGKIVNTQGGVVHFTGIAWAGGAGEPLAEAPEGPREVGFASGACLAVPAAVWSELGGFPPDFFMYSEDVDICLRIRLAGGRVGLEPSARVDHDYEFEKGAAKWRYLERNRWATILRTYPAPLLALVAPALLLTELALVPISIAGGWGAQKLRAWGDTLRALPRLVRERRAIQAGRQVSAGEFASWLDAELSSSYLGATARLAPVRFGLRAYWRAVRALLR